MTPSSRGARRSLHRLAAPLWLCAGLARCAPAATPDAGAPDAAADAPPEGPDASAPALTSAPAVTTRGPVVGRSDGAVRAFLGVPYAAPPVGALRFRPPAEHPTWTAPREVVTRARACPQGPDGVSGRAVPYSEDCLALNVWSPEGPATQRRPVLLFVHGGGFGSGSGGDPLYDGRALAAKGLVVVTVSYRLGQLGFLAHSSLSAEDTEHRVSGNYGFLDQQAALRWVRDNAANFGGDPGNVTLVGESAGGISVCLHLAAPGSRGLFHRAISQSGPCYFVKTRLHDDTMVPYQSAESLGFRFVTALGCAGQADVPACLRSKSVEDILATQPTPFELTITRARFQPTIDGHHIPEDPSVTIAEGRDAPVPLLVGTNRDEGTAFSLMLRVTTQAEYEAAVREMLPDHAAEVLAMYPSSRYESPRKAFEDFLADALFTCPAREHARASAARRRPTFLYRFTRENQAGRLFGLGVFHAAELPYVFNNFPAPFSRQRGDTEVAEATMGYWARFAQSGDPNGAGAVPWPAYDATSDMHLELGEAQRAGSRLRAEQCDRLMPWVRAL